MSHRLEYKERYHVPAHGSLINAIVISPDGHRFVTGSDDSTVVVWSTRNGDPKCRINAHSPVLTLAWLSNTNRFVFGCENGRLALASVGNTRVRALML